MNQLDPEYKRLLNKILTQGRKKTDRTGVGTLSLFGEQIRFKFDGTNFPLLTSKKVYFKGVVHELLWLIAGKTNIKYLVENDVHIWTGDAWKKYSKNVEKYKDINLFNIDGSLKEKLKQYTQEEFTQLILSDPEFAKEHGDLGPTYGKQWRRWFHGDWWYNGSRPMVQERRIDQLQNCIDLLKTNPDDRRMLVNSWNPGQLQDMTLPPCHYSFQFYTRDLTESERFKLYSKWIDSRGGVDTDDVKTTKHFDKFGIPTKAVSLLVNMRSVDVPLGLPFNIASYGLLLNLVAKEVDMMCDELIMNLGDTHIYLNQIEGIKQQLENESYELPSLWLNPEIKKVDDFKYEDIKIVNYKSHLSIKMPLNN
jgi:thymidylate synthase